MHRKSNVVSLFLAFAWLLPRVCEDDSVIQALQVLCFRLALQCPRLKIPQNPPNG